MWILALLPPVALLSIFTVLRTIASFDVVGDGFYILLSCPGTSLAWAGQ